MIRAFHMEIHDASLGRDDKGHSIYTFNLCNGDSYEFAIPTFEDRCEENHG